MTICEEAFQPSPPRAMTDTATRDSVRPFLFGEIKLKIIHITLNFSDSFYECLTLF